jgi:hypothetical protein
MPVIRTAKQKPKLLSSTELEVSGFLNMSFPLFQQPLDRRNQPAGDIQREPWGQGALAQLVFLPLPCWTVQSLGVHRRHAPLLHESL